ncbi:MAG: hypothetical protein AABX47_06950 [Nanoarchaeota archaeon]
MTTRRKASLAKREEERLWFVHYWLAYIRKHPKEAADQYVKFIDAMMEHARAYPFSAKHYLKSKGEPCKR